MIQNVDVLGALEIARWAPSAHNTQPWALRAHDGSVTVYRHASRALTAGDPSGRQTFVSIGAFLEHLCVALAAKGALPRVAITARPGSDEVAQVQWQPAPADQAAADLAEAARVRRTVRAAYRPQLPDALFDSVNEETDENGVSLTVIRDAKTIAAVGDLVAEGTRIALSLPAMRRELATLVHWAEDGACDGMWLAGMMDDVPIASPALAAADYFEAHLDPRIEADRFGRWYASAPALFVISTAFDGPEAWVLAGQRAGRLMLNAAHLGLKQCVSAAPIEVPTISPRFRELVKAPGRPQVLLRLGVPETDDAIPPPPRLAPEHLLV